MAKSKYTKRADGRYAAQITIGVNPKTGKDIRKTVYAKTIAELESKKAHIRTDLERGLCVGKAKKMTVLQYGWKWFDLNKVSKSDSSIERYERMLRMHMTYIGGLQLTEVTRSDIQIQLNQLADKPETQRCLLMTLRQIFNAAVGDRLIQMDPTYGVKLQTAPRTEKDPLSEYEKQCLEEADLDLRERCYVNLMYYTGMRKGEVLALNKKDINLKKGTIYVWSAVAYHGNQPFLKDMPKTQAGVRYIPIPAPLMAILKEYLKGLKGGFLFADEDGQLLSKSAARGLWDRIYRKASDVAGCERQISSSKKVVYLYDPLKGLTCHRFRHNYATMLYYAGVDVKEAARILGHSDIKTTLQIYTHLIEEKSASAEKLDAYLASEEVQSN